jgi:hypothetical protein
MLTVFGGVGGVGKTSYFPAQNPSLEVTRDRSEATQ